MSSLKLLRAMDPRPGEEQVTMSRQVEHRADVETAQALADALCAQLEADPTVASIVVSPQIIRQRTNEGGNLVHIVTAIALVRRKPVVLDIAAAQLDSMLPLEGTFEHPTPTVSPYGEFSKLFEDYLFRHADQVNEKLREMAELMLADGTCGIAMVQIPPPTLVDFTESQPTISAGSTALTLHPHVPYGHLFEFPSMESFDRWGENGYPID
jgi:hypothetical protein